MKNEKRSFAAYPYSIYIIEGFNLFAVAYFINAFNINNFIYGIYY